MRQVLDCLYKDSSTLKQISILLLWIAALNLTACRAECASRATLELFAPVGNWEIAIHEHKMWDLYHRARFLLGVCQLYSVQIGVLFQMEIVYPKKLEQCSFQASTNFLEHGWRQHKGSLPPRFKIFKPPLFSHPSAILAKQPFH